MAFDLGTTHLKWATVESASGLKLWDGSADVTAARHGNASEQDPGRIHALVAQALEEAAAYGTVRAVAFSAAMHSLVVVGPQGQALTGSWTWMDQRARAVAFQLRRLPLARRLREASGVPVYSMSPLVKWLWLKDQMPKGARPVALKDYVVYHLTGEWATDYSTASGSGFLGLDNAWLPEALELAELTPDALPRLTPVDARLSAANKSWAVVLGANDAATAHLHLGVPQDGSVAMLAMGTSGALRTSLSHSLQHPELFCYTMGPGWGYLAGSAFSNVGNVLDWLAHLFHVSIDTLVEEGLHAIRSNRPLPLTLGYWFGERSPWWREDLEGAWLGLRPEHGWAELAGSTLLGIAAAYWHGWEALRDAGMPLRAVCGGSGLLDNPAVAQWMADALGQDLIVQDERDASLWGAVDLARGEAPKSEAPGGACYHPQDPDFPDRVAETWNRIRDEVQRRL